MNQKFSIIRICFRFGATPCSLCSVSLTLSVPACAPPCSTALPTFGVRNAHPGGQPPSCEGCCRDARSPGPRRKRGWESDAPPQPASRDRERDRDSYRQIPRRRQGERKTARDGKQVKDRDTKKREREKERYQDEDRDRYRQREERERENETDKARATEKRKCRALHTPSLCGFFGS